MKAGDFGELLTPSIWFGSAQIIKDPTTGLPFAGNIVPKSQQSPNGMALLAVYPDPNIGTPLGTSNWYGVAAAPTNQRKDTIGIDVLPTTRTTSASAASSTTTWISLRSRPTSCSPRAPSTAPTRPLR